MVHLCSHPVSLHSAAMGGVLLCHLTRQHLGGACVPKALSCTSSRRRSVFSSINVCGHPFYLYQSLCLIQLWRFCCCAWCCPHISHEASCRTFPLHITLWRAGMVCHRGFSPGIPPNARLDAVLLQRTVGQIHDHPRPPEHVPCC